MQTTRIFVLPLEAPMYCVLSFTLFRSHFSHEGTKMAHDLELPAWGPTQALSLKNFKFFFQCWAVIEHCLDSCSPRVYTEPCSDTQFSIFSTCPAQDLSFCLALQGAVHVLLLSIYYCHIRTKHTSFGHLHSQGCRCLLPIFQIS